MSGEHTVALKFKHFAKHALRALSRHHLTQQQLVTQLQLVGVKPGGTLLVHSSLSSLGFVAGGAKTVIWALMESIGAEGTLVLPTHSWVEMDAGCRTFDVRQTRSCVGIIPEVFRSLPGVIRSLHPTHSVAATGPAASRLIEGHEDARTPCGPGTPYLKALDQDCQILFLGVDLQCNTAFHTIEAVAELPYLMNRDPDQFTIIDYRARAFQRSVFRHQPGISRRFRELEGPLSREGIIRSGQIGEARALLIGGAAFRDFMIEMIGANPSILLARDLKENGQ
jgi:aminoglycoside 3-N-acetyltransferase